MDEYGSGNPGSNNNPNRNYGMQRHHRGNRFRHGRGGQQMQHQGKSRSQRPLLTSAINGAGLSLVALVVLGEKAKENPNIHLALGIAVVCFGVSSIVSYFAQRVRPAIFEKLSDLFFLAGACILVYCGLGLGGLL